MLEAIPASALCTFAIVLQILLAGITLSGRARRAHKRFAFGWRPCEGRPWLMVPRTPVRAQAMH
jgi:hypothetical protein